MNRPLADRVAVVTGAGRGIGRATARALAEAGARVVVNDFDRGDPGRGETTSLADRVAAEIEATGGQAVANTDSVSEAESAARIIASAQDHFGRLDILVNNAGLNRSTELWKQDPDEFHAIVASHLHGSWHCLRAAAPIMQAAGFGRVVNLVSRAGLIGVPGQTAYGAGKGGVFALTNVASLELAPFGITVNAVNPSATETRMVTEPIEAFRKEGGAAAEMAEGLAAAMQPPEAVANLIVSLCLPAAGRFNGEIFYIEKERIGLFAKLDLRDETRHEGTGSLDDIARALERLAPAEAASLYRDD